MQGELVDRIEPLQLHPSTPIRSNDVQDALTNDTEEEVVRKVDFQKADDAKVPVHLWDSMYLRSRRHDPALREATPVTGWRRALELLRKGMIRVWRRRLL